MWLTIIIIQCKSSSSSSSLLLSWNYCNPWLGCLVSEALSPNHGPWVPKSLLD